MYYPKPLNKIILILVAVSAVAVQLGFCQDSTMNPKPDLSRFPVINQHQFVPSTYISSPFFNTFIRISTGTGNTYDTEIPIIEIDGEKVGLFKGELFYLLINVGFQFAVQDWAAISFRYTAKARAGDDAPSVIAQGINSLSSFDFGWLFKLYQSKKSLLSTSLNLTNASYTRIDVYQYVQDIINGRESNLTRHYNPLRGVFGLRYAYAYNTLMGFNAVGEIAYGERILQGEEKNDLSYTLGGAASINFHKSHQVDLGVCAGFRYSSFSISTDPANDDVQAYFLKVAYTGRTDFSIGLESAWNISKTKILKKHYDISFLSNTVEIYYYF